MTKDELNRRLADLAMDADDSGFHIAANGLLLMVRCSKLPMGVARRVANTASLLVEVANG